MELKKSQIKRIDTFLERLGCEYIDIRFEMVDHIATEIEENVTDYDDFFYKNGMQGKFLTYMLSKKKDLQKTYYDQSKKQFWLTLSFVLKLIVKQLFIFRNIILVILSFLIIQKAVIYNLKYTLTFVSLIAVISYIFSAYTFKNSIRSIGKIKIIHSFISLSTLPFAITFQIYNTIKVMYSENNEMDDVGILLIYSLLTYVIFNTFLTMVFINNINQFKAKYKHLLS